MKLPRGGAARSDLLRVTLLGAILFVFTDGPLFFLSNDVLGRPVVSWRDEVVAGGLTAAAAACGALVAWDLWRTGGRSPQRPHPWAAPAVGAFVVLIAASSLWSVGEVVHTGWQAAVYAGLALLAWQLADVRAAAWKPLALMAAAGVAASLATVAVDPATSVDPNGDWRGIYHNRNLLAPVAGVGVIAGVRMLGAGDRALRAAGAALALGSLASMVGAGSRTAWLALGVGMGLAALPVLRRLLERRWDPRRASAAVWVALTVGASVLVAVAIAVWDTSTFAQRRTIWRVSWEQFLERPLHGHGFAAVWSWPEFLDHPDRMGLGSAHNGLLEVLLGLGVLGTVPFVVIVVLAVGNAGRDLLRAPSADTWMWAAVVVMMLIENTTESLILRYSYNWVIVMAAALRTPWPRSQRDARVEAREPRRGRRPLIAGAGS